MEHRGRMSATLNSKKTPPISPLVPRFSEDTPPDPELRLPSLLKTTLLNGRRTRFDSRNLTGRGWRNVAFLAAAGDELLDGFPSPFD